MNDHIEFTPAPADMAAAARDLRPRNWGRWDRLRLVLAGVLIALLIFFAIARYVWQQHGVYIVYWEDMAAFSFAGAVLGWGYGKVSGRFSADDPRLTERSFSLGKDGFETRGRRFETKVDWTGVADIADRRDTIFFIAEWKEYYFVPKRAFADAAAAEAFERTARDFWSARRDGRNPAPVEARARPDRYSLAYRLERADMAAFAALRRELTGWRKALIFLPAVLLGAIGAWIRESNPDFSAWLDRMGTFAVVAAVLVGAGAWYLVVTVAMSAVRALQVRRAKLPEGQTRLAADKSGVQIAADGSTERLAWREIPAVTLGPAHVFLSTTPASAVIVPLRAFTGRAAMVEFYTFAEEASKHAEA
ncbi:MAG: YcxB family protein [Bauldia sp.]